MQTSSHSAKQSATGFGNNVSCSQVIMPSFDNLDCNISIHMQQLYVQGAQGFSCLLSRQPSRPNTTTPLSQPSASICKKGAFHCLHVHIMHFHNALSGSLAGQRRQLLLGGWATKMLPRVACSHQVQKAAEGVQLEGRAQARSPRFLPTCQMHTDVNCCYTHSV